MLPPLTTVAVFSPLAFTSPAMHAATLAAPAGSATDDQCPVGAEDLIGQDRLAPWLAKA